MNTLKWGIVGCGDVARKRVAQAIRDEPRSELVAACRRDATHLRDFCDTFQVARAYSDADALFSDPDIDVVYIATPVRDHLPQTLAAAAVGKHVLVEKPMAMSVDECDQMIEACRRADVKLGVAYYRRFYPLVRRMEELIREGVIGKPMAVTAVTSTPLPSLPTVDEESAAVGGWRVVPEEGGGGALMDVGSHRINLFTHLFGPVREVKAICECVAGGYVSEDSAVVLMAFQNGMVGTLQCHFRDAADPDEFNIFGTQGRLQASPLNGSDLIVETRNGRRTETHPPATNLSAPLVSDFVTCILENRQPMVTGEEGRTTNEIMQSAYADSKM